MAEQINDEELAVEQTQGFKVAEKKTIDEYQKLGMSTSSMPPLAQQAE